MEIEIFSVKKKMMMMNKFSRLKSVHIVSSSDKLASTKTSNLKRHTRRLYPRISVIVNEKDKETISTATTSKLTKGKKYTNTVTGGLELPLSRFFSTNKVTVTMNNDLFKKHIIEMVAKNSIPLTFFAASISRPEWKNGLETLSFFGKMIIEEALTKKELKSILKGRFVFLKIDGSTHHQINYFAINVRFVNNKK